MALCGNNGARLFFLHPNCQIVFYQSQHRLPGYEYTIWRLPDWTEMLCRYYSLINHTVEFGVLGTECFLRLPTCLDDRIATT